MAESFIYYDLDITLKKKLPEAFVDGRYVTRIEATIYHYHKDDDIQRTAGKFAGYFVDTFRGENEGMNALDEVDDHSDELAETLNLFDVKMRYGTRLNRKAIKALGEKPEDYISFTDNYVHLSRLAILPKYRGRGVGTWALREILEYLAFSLEVSFFTLTPCPLQSLAATDQMWGWQKRMRYDKLSSDIPASEKKLKVLYGQLGFVEVKGTKLMIAGAGRFAEGFIG